MWNRTLLFGLSLLLVPSPLEACSCFGPSTFCETMQPFPGTFPPDWVIPDHVVLGVKLATVEYGVDLQVIQDFRGGLAADEIIRVWGDCGFLCRTYNGWVEYGDTVLWGIKPCDLAGNMFCGASQFEAPEHYQLPVCGIYWLGYSNGVVSGPLFTEGASETIELEDFEALVNGCLATSIEARSLTEASVSCTSDGILIRTTHEWSENKQVCITDATGRLLLNTGFLGELGSIPLPVHAAGILMVTVRDEQRSFTARILAN